jgi:ABC-type lipoprotein export system ATPase subunit
MDIRIDNLFLENISENPQSDLFRKKVEFKENSRILLSGASGTGKTTFVSLLYGLQCNFSGSIIYKNKNIKTLKKKNWVFLRQKKLSAVFQDLKLFTELTGHENIHIKNQLAKYKNTKDIENILNELGILNISEKKISNMSFGEKQRFAIARALVQPFSWLILDEPFSHLDKKNRDKACRLIERECTERKAGIILAEHDDENLFDYDLKLNL